MMQKPLGQENKRRGNREVRGEGEARLGYAGARPRNRNCALKASAVMK